MEPVHYITIKESIEAYGFFDQSVISKIVQQVYKSLLILKKLGHYHGRMNGNNVFFEQMTLEVKISDYCIYNVFTRGEITLEEGSRFDIVNLGVMILKMMGKLRVNDVTNIGPIMKNTQAFVSLYKNEGISSKISNFLDLCFDERTTLEILKRCPLLSNYSFNSVIIEEASSNEGGSVKGDTSLKDSPASENSFRSNLTLK